MRTALLLVVAFAAPAAAADDTYSLKWSLKEGDKFFAKNETVLDMSMMVMGQAIDAKMTVTTVQRFKVLTVKQDATTVEMTMLSWDMNAGGLPGGIPGLGDLGEKIKGTTLTAVFDSEMTVTKLQGYDKFLDKLSGDDENARKMMKMQMSEATLSQMFSQVFSVGNSKPVKTGDTWQREDKMSVSGLDATTKMKYKLDSVSNGVANLSWKGDMGFKGGKGFPGLPEGLTIDKFDMKADKFEGKIKFDTKLGRLVDSKQDADVKGAIGFSLMGQKLDMKMDIKMKQTVTIEDKNPIKD